MGILKNIFGESSEAKTPKLKWIELNDINQLETISKSERTTGIFKHSTRCGTSMMVKRRFESEFDLEGEEIDIYYLDLIAHRDISNELATKYNVRHESPQLLVVKNDQLIADESHYGVTQLDLKAVI